VNRLRRAAASPIDWYQRYLSGLKSPSCRFAPSCSAYTRQALLLHGLTRGSWLALKRILRCQPLCRGGYDPVPPPHRRA
jgi:putative membrane protein insertion efficiency factor